MQFQCKDFKKTRLDLNGGDMVVVSHFSSAISYVDTPSERYHLFLLIKTTDIYGDTFETEVALTYYNIDDMYDDLIRIQDTRQFSFTIDLGGEATCVFNKELNSRRHVLRLARALKSKV